jgi:hypothetical protein
LDLLDLNAICQFYGRDFMPYPFMFTAPSRFASADAFSAYTNSVPDRFMHGDLNIFNEWVTAYYAADIRVECRVQYIPADTPSMRVIACRAGQLGFLAAQRPEADQVDIYTLSPYDLGAAISDATQLTKPGKHLEIVVPEYVSRSRAEFDTGDFAIHHKLQSRSEVTIPASEVTAYATVQSHWRPVRDWGFYHGKRALVWVRVNDDGEYLYVPDYPHARPLTKSLLHKQIDLLIAEDVAILREFHSD